MGKVFKWIGIILGSLIGLLLLAGVIVYFVGNSKLNKRYALDVNQIPISNDPAAIARGEHIANAITPCVDCHGKDLSGAAIIDDPMMATISAVNLTSGKGGIGSTFKDEDWVRALRYGVSPEGKGLIIMPVVVTTNFSDEDLSALIAYLKSLPPVDHTPPAKRYGPMGYLLVALGQLPPLAPDQVKGHPARPASVPHEVSVAYGEYLVSVAGCRDCHGLNLAGTSGGDPNGPPAAPNLTPAGELSIWNEADFINTLHTGVKPSGVQLSDEMPWKSYGKMTDDELKAIWMYLQTIPADSMEPGA
jgi:cytochrome c553